MTRDYESTPIVQNGSWREWDLSRAHADYVFTHVFAEFVLARGYALCMEGTGHLGDVTI